MKKQEARRKKWKEHFQEVLNEVSPDQPPQDERDELEEFGILVGAPTREEIGKTLKTKITQTVKSKYINFQ